MGSSRFPGKMLREIAGKPVIWHVIHRLRQCASVERIILATSDQDVDDTLAEYATALGVTVVRGSEQNVLRRFIAALKRTDADIILRITGDAPLIDPVLIDRLVSRLRQSGADYVTFAAPASDCGIDPVTRQTLLRLAAKRGDHPVAIEHVTGYFAVDPVFARRAVLPAFGENRFVEGARFSVDTPADLAFFEEIYRRLGAAPGEAKFLDAIALLRSDPSLLAINAHVRQRRADERAASILIRCDGGHAQGLGHVVRCLAIARELRERYSAAVRFAVGGDEAAFALVRAEDFPIVAAKPGGLAALVAGSPPDVALVDLRTPFDEAEFEALRRVHCRIAVLDDPGERRLHADLAFYPPSGARLDWRSAVGERLIGFDWIPLRRQFAPPPPRRLSEPKLALIIGGGSDPANIGYRFLASAARALPNTWHIAMVIGPAAAEDPRIEDMARLLGPRLSLERQVGDMAALMARADLALASFGMSAYELAAVGVPMLLLCLSEDHARSAVSLAENGAAEILGLAQRVKDGAIDRAIARLASDDAQREELGRKARRLVNGAGARRIAERLVALANSPRLITSAA
jgi:spore coat polysaccharide biosynthesis protein SpsF